MRVDHGDDERARHMYVVGKSGSGKSTLLFNLKEREQQAAQWDGRTPLQCLYAAGKEQTVRVDGFSDLQILDMRKRAVASTKAEAERFAKNVAPIIHEIQSSGVVSHRGIARSLNARGVATARGGEWTAVQVGSILQRVEAH